MDNLQVWCVSKDGSSWSSVAFDTEAEARRVGPDLLKLTTGSRFFVGLCKQEYPRVDGRETLLSMGYNVIAGDSESLEEWLSQAFKSWADTQVPNVYSLSTYTNVKECTF